MASIMKCISQQWNKLLETEFPTRLTHSCIHIRCRWDSQPPSAIWHNVAADWHNVATDALTLVQILSRKICNPNRQKFSELASKSVLGGCAPPPFLFLFFVPIFRLYYGKLKSLGFSSAGWTEGPPYSNPPPPQWFRRGLFQGLHHKCSLLLFIESKANYNCSVCVNRLKGNQFSCLLLVSPNASHCIAN